jgi:hypothetical protein
MRVNVFRRLRAARMTLPVEFMRPISREAVNALPIERAAADFAAERVVGFDTETRPRLPGRQRLPGLRIKQCLTGPAARRWSAIPQR